MISGSKYEFNNLRTKMKLLKHLRSGEKNILILGMEEGLVVGFFEVILIHIDINCLSLVKHYCLMENVKRLFHKLFIVIHLELYHAL